MYSTYVSVYQSDNVRRVYRTSFSYTELSFSVGTQAFFLRVIGDKDFRDRPIDALFEMADYTLGLEPEDRKEDTQTYRTVHYHQIITRTTQRYYRRMSPAEKLAAYHRSDKHVDRVLERATSSEYPFDKGTTPYRLRLQRDGIYVLKDGAQLHRFDYVSNRNYHLNGCSVFRRPQANAPRNLCFEHYLELYFEAADGTPYTFYLRDNRNGSALPLQRYLEQRLGGTFKLREGNSRDTTHFNGKILQRRYYPFVPDEV